MIDPGFHKAKTYDPSTNTAALETFRVAKSNVRQRKGRAGRCRAGHFFKMYKKKHYDSFLDHDLPEMKRTPVEELVMQVGGLLVVGLGS